MEASMKATARLLGTLLLAALSPALLAQSETAAGLEPVALNRIIAIVNNDVIVRSELDDEIVTVLAQLKEKDTELPPRDIIEKQVLERLIVKRLQLQLGENSGITIDDNTLNSELQELAKKNGVTLTEFREVLLKEGYDYAKFREDVRQEMIIAQLRRQMVTNRIKVSDQEVENLLANLEASQQGNTKYRLSHILISVPEAASPESIQAAEQHATVVLGRLRAGADFAKTAIAESDGQTALDGGDIGWRSIGQMPSLFVEQVQKMEAGEISDLIRSPGGFHIIMVREKQGDERYIITQTRVRHILIKPDALQSGDEVKIRMQQLEKRIRGGDDFAVLAKSHSQDTLSAAKGGDLGWVNPGDLVPRFEEVMGGLKADQLSQPFETQFGWHLVQVMERREHDNTDEYRRSRARQLIRSRKNDEELYLWLRRLRDEAYIEYRLES